MIHDSVSDVALHRTAAAKSLLLLLGELKPAYLNAPVFVAEEEVARAGFGRTLPIPVYHDTMVGGIFSETAEM
jgi:hypothetical protein